MCSVLQEVGTCIPVPWEAMLRVSCPDWHLGWWTGSRGYTLCMCNGQTRPDVVLKYQVTIWSGRGNHVVWAWSPWCVCNTVFNITKAMRDILYMMVWHLSPYYWKKILHYYCNTTCNVNVYCNVLRPEKYILQCLAVRAIDIAISRNPSNSYCNVSRPIQ